MRRIITCAVAGLVLLVFSGEIIAAPAPQPDLIMTTVAYAASANAGRNVNVTNTVQNTGNLDTATSFYVRFYLSTNNTIGGGDINLGQRLISGGLLISETDTAVSAVTIPAGTAPGTYYIIARADATGVVPESDNTNNDLAGNQITITLYVPTSTVLGGGCTSGSGGGRDRSRGVRSRRGDGSRSEKSGEAEPSPLLPLPTARIVRGSAVSLPLGEGWGEGYSSRRDRSRRRTGRPRAPRLRRMRSARPSRGAAPGRQAGPVPA